MGKKKAQPSEAELAILRTLWSRGASSVRDVHESLGGDQRTRYTTTLFWLWVVGVAVLSLWHIAAWILSQRFRRHGTTATAEVLDMVRKISQRLGIRRVIAVRQTVEAAAPMVIGWIKPVLVLPMSVLMGLSAAELEAVLAHELAHIRRHDYLVNLVQAVIETVLFYHPAVSPSSGAGRPMRRTQQTIRATQPTMERTIPFPLVRDGIGDSLSGLT